MFFNPFKKKDKKIEEEKENNQRMTELLDWARNQGNKETEKVVQEIFANAHGVCQELRDQLTECEENLRNLQGREEERNKQIAELQEQKSLLEQQNQKLIQEAIIIRDQNKDLIEARKRADMRAGAAEKYKKFYEDEQNKLKILEKALKTEKERTKNIEDREEHYKTKANDLEKKKEELQNELTMLAIRKKNRINNSKIPKLDTKN